VLYILIVMAAKKKHSWDSEFKDTLSSRKAKEEAQYLATIKARTDGVKRTWNGQLKKDQYNKVMREYDDSAKRDCLTVDTHKERIQFLENVLNENRQWCPGTSEPLQLKPNPVELQAKIDEMRRYVEARAKSGGTHPKPRSAARPVSKSRELTREQVGEIYERAKIKILQKHGRTVERLTKNVLEGLPVARARERLLAQGVMVQVVDAFYEIAIERGLAFSEDEKNAIKLFLLNPERLGSFIDMMIVK